MVPHDSKSDLPLVYIENCNLETENIYLKLLFIHKTVSFCGKGQLTSEGNKAIKSGCYTQGNHQEGLDVEACFCEADGCNGSIPVVSQLPNNLFIILLYCYFSFLLL